METERGWVCQPSCMKSAVVRLRSCPRAEARGAANEGRNGVQSRARCWRCAIWGGWRPKHDATAFLSPRFPNQRASRNHRCGALAPWEAAPAVCAFPGPRTARVYFKAQGWSIAPTPRAPFPNSPTPAVARAIIATTRVRAAIGKGNGGERTDGTRRGGKGKRGVKQVSGERGARLFFCPHRPAETPHFFFFSKKKPMLQGCKKKKGWKKEKRKERKRHAEEGRRRNQGRRF